MPWSRPVDTKGLSPFELRDLLMRKLIKEKRDDLAQVLLDCGEKMDIRCVCCDDVLTIERGCKKRWCPVCAPKITAKRYRRLEGLVNRMQWPLSVCLTTRNKINAEGALESFKESFHSFQRTAFWKATVEGGVAGFEVTHRDKGWHVHLHAILDCRWLAVKTPEPNRRMTKQQQKSLCERAQDELSEVWGAYVQGSKAMVWVNRRLGSALAETLKYAIKPSDLLEAKCKAHELIDMIDTGRAVTTFGNCHACSKNFIGRDLPEETLQQCRSCNGIKTMLPDDIVQMYLNRPDLAYGRFHTLASLNGEPQAGGKNHDGKMTTWNYSKTLPQTIAKGFKAGKFRQEMEALNAALPPEVMEWWCDEADDNFIPY